MDSRAWLTDSETGLRVALGVGLLVGVERERRKGGKRLRGAFARRLRIACDKQFLDRTSFRLDRRRHQRRQIRGHGQCAHRHQVRLGESR